MPHIAKAAPHSLALPGRTGVAGVVAALVRLVTRWSERRRSRIALSHLDDRLLRDIGRDALTRDREAGRPFWQ